MGKGPQPPHEATQPVVMTGNRLKEAKATFNDKFGAWKGTIDRPDENGDYDKFAALKSCLDELSKSNISYPQLGVIKSDQKLIDATIKHFKHFKPEQQVQTA